MVDDPPRPLRRVLRYVRQALMMSQVELGEAIGLSRRTIIRWERGQSSPVPFQAQQLVDLVRPEEPDLADELLAAMGMEPAVAGAPSVDGPVTSLGKTPGGRHIIDAVVYAAADAIDGVPRDVRRAVTAAFVRAREMGLSVEEVAQALLAPHPPSS
jgi:DNA-binding XRE family transcriptional regulator